MHQLYQAIFFSNAKPAHLPSELFSSSTASPGYIVVGYSVAKDIYQTEVTASSVISPAVEIELSVHSADTSNLSNPIIIEFEVSWFFSAVCLLSLILNPLDSGKTAKCFDVDLCIKVLKKVIIQHFHRVENEGLATL